MSQEIDRHEIAMRYVLGTLSEEEKTHLEDRYFFDDTEFEELEIAEDELIERYVQAELSPEDTRHFDRLLTSPRLAERVEIARLLAKRVASRPTQPQIIEAPGTSNPPVVTSRPSWWKGLFGPVAAFPVFRPALATSMVLMLMMGVALVFVGMKLQAESQRLAAEQQQREQLKRQIEEEKAKYAELDAKLKQTQQDKEEQEKLAEKYQQLLRQQQGQAQGLVLAFNLVPGATRGGSGGNKVVLPRDATAVNLDLDVEGSEYSLFAAALRNVDERSKVITQRSGLKPFPKRGRKHIRLNVARKLLPPGTYSIHVDGLTGTRVDGVEEYSFQVVDR